MRKPKVLNPPERIYLQFGDISIDCDYRECDEVTWCEEAIHESDLEYRLVKRRLKGKAKSES